MHRYAHFGSPRVHLHLSIPRCCHAQRPHNRCCMAFLSVLCMRQRHGTRKTGSKVASFPKPTNEYSTQSHRMRRCSPARVSPHQATSVDLGSAFGSMTEREAVLRRYRSQRGVDCVARKCMLEPRDEKRFKSRFCSDHPSEDCRIACSHLPARDRKERRACLARLIANSQRRRLRSCFHFPDIVPRCDCGVYSQNPMANHMNKCT